MAAHLALTAGFMVAEAVVADGQDDLLSKHFMEVGNFLAQVILNSNRINSEPGKIAGEKDFSGLVNDFYGYFP